MAKLTDEVSSFTASQHFLLLDAALKSHAEPLLAHWCDAVGDVVSEESMRRALHGVARLDVPLRQRQDSLEAQLLTLSEMAKRAGCYDADDWLKKQKETLK